MDERWRDAMSVSKPPVLAGDMLMVDHVAMHVMAGLMQVKPSTDEIDSYGKWLRMNAESAYCAAFELLAARERFTNTVVSCDHR